MGPFPNGRRRMVRPLRTARLGTRPPRRTFPVRRGRPGRSLQLSGSAHSAESPGPPRSRYRAHRGRVRTRPTSRRTRALHLATPLDTPHKAHGESNWLAADSRFAEGHRAGPRNARGRRGRSGMTVHTGGRRRRSRDRTRTERSVRRVGRARRPPTIRRKAGSTKSTWPPREMGTRPSRGSSRNARAPLRRPRGCRCEARSGGSRCSTARTRACTVRSRARTRTRHARGQWDTRSTRGTRLRCTRSQRAPRRSRHQRRRVRPSRRRRSGCDSACTRRGRSRGERGGRVRAARVEARGNARGCHSAVGGEFSASRQWPMAGA